MSVVGDDGSSNNKVLSTNHIVSETLKFNSDTEETIEHLISRRKQKERVNIGFHTV